MSDSTARQQVFGEFVGTMFLLMGVVGSGIMASRLSTDFGLQLLQNAIATGAILTALIITYAKMSGAHFNPVVTLAFRAQGAISNRMAGWYVVAQFVGAVLGTIIANLMFELPGIAAATTERAGSHLFVSEIVATVGLIVVIVGAWRAGADALIPFSVGTYIAAAYYFTSSTSFANPAVTVARTLTDSFSGITLGSAAWFVGAQAIGLIIAVGIVQIGFPERTTT